MRFICFALFELETCLPQTWQRHCLHFFTFGSSKTFGKCGSSLFSRPALHLRLLQHLRKCGSPLFTFGSSKSFDSRAAPHSTFSGHRNGPLV